MTDVTAPQTKLDAINLVLWSIGETPVNSLDVTGIKDVALAELQLDRVTREVLSKGWDFNTDDEWELTPDQNNHILVPSNALRITPCDPTKRVVVRDNGGQRMLWDKDERSFEFTEPIKVNIVWAYEFDQIPEEARNYIAVRAARLFQAGAMGSELIFKFTELHEREALANFRRAHAKTRRANLLVRDPIFHRRYNP